MLVEVFPQVSGQLYHQAARNIHIKHHPKQTLRFHNGWVRNSLQQSIIRHAVLDLQVLDQLTDYHILIVQQLGKRASEQGGLIVEQSCKE